MLLLLKLLLLLILLNLILAVDVDNKFIELVIDDYESLLIILIRCFDNDDCDCLLYNIGSSLFDGYFNSLFFIFLCDTKGLLLFFLLIEMIGYCSIFASFLFYTKCYNNKFSFLILYKM